MAFREGKGYNVTNGGHEQHLIQALRVSRLWGPPHLRFRAAPIFPVAPTNCFITGPISMSIIKKGHARTWLPGYGSPNMTCPPHRDPVLMLGLSWIEGGGNGQEMGPLLYNQDHMPVQYRVPESGLVHLCECWGVNGSVDRGAFSLTLRSHQRLGGLLRRWIRTFRCLFPHRNDWRVFGILYPKMA
jgi:hypothetical protein